MKKTLKNRDVFTLPAGKVELTVAAGAEAWVECSEAEMQGEVSVKLKPGSHLRWMSFYAGCGKKSFVLEEGARLEYFHHVLGESEEAMEVTLAGNESSVLSQVIFFGRATQKQTLRMDHVHEGKNTRSEMISRGAVKDSAFSHFYGNIRMLSGCSGADGTLEEHNLLLSNGSKIEAIPALEIHHDEVQATHSATLERVDDEKLFYLKSRGLKEREGLELLVEGFFWEALQRCSNLAFSERIFKTILKCLAR